jgi:hypothetical protein
MNQRRKVTPGVEKFIYGRAAAFFTDPAGGQRRSFTYTAIARNLRRSQFEVWLSPRTVARVVKRLDPALFQKRADLAKTGPRSAAYLRGLKAWNELRRKHDEEESDA